MKISLLVRHDVDKDGRLGRSEFKNLIGQFHITMSEQAAYRHAQFELGINLQKLYFIANYRYKFALNNIVENEICPIYLAISDELIKINKNEIEEIQLFEWLSFISFLKKYQENFTPWCIEELNLLTQSNIFKNFMDSAL